MKNKGFTLVELLAVIVIIGLLAVLIVPKVNKTLKDARKSINKTSISGLTRTANNYYAENASMKRNFQGCSYNFTTDTNTCDNLEFTGEKPKTGKLKINKEGKISIVAQFDKKCYIKNYDSDEIIEQDYSEETCNLGFRGTYVAPTDTDTHKGIVYIDPTDLKKTCNETLASQNINQFDEPTGVNTGCMKFYIYDENSDGTVDMILDHNTSGNIYWDRNATATSSSMKEVAVRLTEDTEDWLGNPRLIYADEIAHIVGADREDTIKWDKNKEVMDYYEPDNIDKITSFYLDGSGTTYSKTDGWKKQVADLENKSRYSWLYDYTECERRGCNNYDGRYYYSNDLRKENNSESITNTGYYISGYWTQDNTADKRYVWVVDYTGELKVATAFGTGWGVRPVITLSKESLEID